MALCRVRDIDKGALKLNGNNKLNAVEKQLQEALINQEYEQAQMLLEKNESSIRPIYQSILRHLLHLQQVILNRSGETLQKDFRLMEAIMNCI